MDLHALQKFFLWCTIINGTLLIFWTLIFITAGDSLYRFHGRMFSISREAFNLTLYGFLGVFKIFFLVFNLAPCVALMIL